MKKGLNFTHADALRRLKKDKPLELSGGLKIKIRHFMIRVYSERKTGKTKEGVYYQVHLPSEDKELHTSDWNEVVDTVTAEAGILAASITGKIIRLKDEKAFHYEMLEKAASDCKDKAGVARLLQTIGLTFGKDLAQQLADPLSALLLAGESPESLASIIQDGLGFQDFARHHAYMQKGAILPYFNKSLPDITKLPTNESLWKQYLFKKRRNLTIGTYEQYGHHLENFDKYINKPFLFVEPGDADGFIEQDTVEETEEGDLLKPSTHDHKKDVLRPFFAWLIRHGHYPAERGNPVFKPKLGMKGRSVNPDHIISPANLQRWLDAVQWEDLPYLVCTAIMGIRPETVERLSWDHFDWIQKIVEIDKSISKCGEARPPLTDLVFKMLEPWMGREGAVVVHNDTPKRVRQVAKDLGFITKFRNHSRKSAISYSWMMLRQTLTFEKAEDIMKERFGNSKVVRNIYYKAKVSLPDSLDYLKCSRIITDVQISPADAENYRKLQIHAALRTHLAVALKERRYNAVTPLRVVENISEAGIKKATPIFQVPSLPSFVVVSASAPNRFAPVAHWKRTTTRVAPRSMADVSSAFVRPQRLSKRSKVDSRQIFLALE